jgi:hydroxyacylglutathione hydrolase
MHVTDHVHTLRVPFKVPLGPSLSLDRFVYCYVIFGEEICLVDTGVAGTEDIIFDLIRGAGRHPEEITTIIQTHAHPDHVGSTKAIKAKCHCQVLIHEAEVRWLEDVDVQFAERPVPGFHNLVGGSVEVDRALREGDKVDLGGSNVIEVVHTPGHSAGSISLLSREEGVLITGDAVPLVGEMPVYEDATASMRSLERLLAIDGVDFLLGSWDIPRKGEEVGSMIEGGLEYLRRIDTTVAEITSQEPRISSDDLCRRVIDRMKLNVPPLPLVARSFQSNLRARNQ